VINVLLINKLEFIFVNNKRRSRAVTSGVKVGGTFAVSVETTALARMEVPEDEGLNVVAFFPMFEASPKFPQTPSN